MSRHGEPSGDSWPLLALIALLTALPRLRLLSAVVVMVAVIGVGDCATGPDVSFGVMYLVPVFLAAAATRAAGVAISAAAAATWSLIEMTLRTVPFSAAWVPIWNVLARFSVLALIAVLVSALAAKLANESRLSRTDALTGLLNARGFHEAIAVEISRLRRAGGPLTTAYIDIDHFKAINDGHGHRAGDRVLEVAAATMTEVMRDTDRISRLGGDEFAIVLPGTGVEEAVPSWAGCTPSLHTATSTYGFGIGFSIGAVTVTEPPRLGHELVEGADRVMYEVKLNGKDGVVCRPLSSAAHRGVRPADTSVG
jgi:diguanylate cyclase (GGDEF)-like protein